MLVITYYAHLTQQALTKLPRQYPLKWTVFNPLNQEEELTVFIGKLRHPGENLLWVY